LFYAGVTRLSRWLSVSAKHSAYLSTHKSLDYIIQGHRFDIVEDFGCRPTIYVSVPAILLFYTPIAVVVILTLIFSGLAFRAFYLRRRTFRLPS
jgi:hypothetical protein